MTPETAANAYLSWAAYRDAQAPGSPERANAEAQVKAILSSMGLRESLTWEVDDLAAVPASFVFVYQPKVFYALRDWADGKAPAVPGLTFAREIVAAKPA